MLCVLAERAGQPVPLGTWTVATPSGGAQLYYAAPAGTRLGNTAKHLAPLIDTRAWGGQVAAPPTTRDDGTPYLLTLDAPLLALPGWLADLWPAAYDPAHQPATARAPAGRAEHDGLPPAHPRPAGHAGRVDRVTAYVEKAITGEWRRVRGVHGEDTTPEKGRNHTLFTAAVALGQLIGGGHLTTARATAELLDAAGPHLDVCADCARDAPRTIASGLTRGSSQPRHLHPKGSAA
jgi:hypothetical protein